MGWYVAAGPLGRVGGPWHADDGCPDLAEELRLTWRPTLGVTALAAATGALGLARDQVAAGREPCQRCAYGQILAELFELAGAGGPGGHHVLFCKMWHWTTSRQCMLCAALRVYASGSAAHLVALAGDKVALLGPGALPGSLGSLLGQLHLAWENTLAPAEAVPVSAPLWKAAARLYHHPATLGQVLAAAAALYAAPPDSG